MKYRIAADARPQLRMLILATVVSIALWLIPYAWILSYPFRIFVTFIHEGSHALAALVTWNSVTSLSVAPDASGLTTIAGSGSGLGIMFFSSAGYLGSMAFGVLLLFLLRRSVRSNLILFASGGIVLALTVLFGLIKPIWSLSGFSGIPFTLIAGLVISAGLIAFGLFSSRGVARFLVSFLAVQCILNALFDLGNVFVLSSPFTSTRVFTDAVNMQTVTGIPPIVWTLVWIGMGIVLLAIGLRLYVTVKSSRPVQPDLPFDPPVDI